MDLRLRSEQKIGSHGRPEPAQRAGRHSHLRSYATYRKPRPRLELRRVHRSPDCGTITVRTIDRPGEYEPQNPHPIAEVCSACELQRILSFGESSRKTSKLWISSSIGIERLPRAFGFGSTITCSCSRLACRRRLTMSATVAIVNLR